MIWTRLANLFGNQSVEQGQAIRVKVHISANAAIVCDGIYAHRPADVSPHLKIVLVGVLHP